MTLTGAYTIRPADREDSLFWYRLSHDLSVLAMSTRRSMHSLAEHNEWFMARLNQSTQRLFVMEVAGISVGFVRYGKCGDGELCQRDEAEVSVAVSPNHRRLGYARTMLLDTEPFAKEWLSIDRVAALVLFDNSASFKLFWDCGYRYTSDESRLGKNHRRLEKTI